MTETQNQRLYFGYTLSEVMNAGEDILARTLLRDGQPTLERVQGILPAIRENRYLFLSGLISWHGLTVTPEGWVYPQESAACPVPPPIFSPLSDAYPMPHPIFSPLEEVPDAERAHIKQVLSDGWIPVVTTTYTLGTQRTDITCFVEFCDPGSFPQLWVDVTRDNGDRRCYTISRSQMVIKRAILPEEYDETKQTTIAQWQRLALGFDRFSLPYPELQTGIKAMTANLLNTFSGDHAHYGHRYYGREIHDNFPPNYLYGIELCMTLGLIEQAWGMLTHLLRFGIDVKGRICYRQGSKDLYAASGGEYGRLFWLIARLHEADPPGSSLRSHVDTLILMGNYLLMQVRLVERSGYELIMMCAEADTRSRVHAYVSNNLWAVVGLRSLSRIMNMLGNVEGKNFAARAEVLWQNIRSALDAETLPSEFGPLVPFQLGYTARPLTLSLCRNVPNGPLPEDYFKQLDFDARIDKSQDYSENTYANYRYYAEMLSSGLLRSEEADAIVAMREKSGGELLGMTRLYERLDDWPADNYARFFLETDRLDKFLLLYYAHILYHGNLDTGIYYEQVTADGAAFAPDCVPSMALIPLMTAWMFCFQPVNDNAVFLLRGIPADWFAGSKPFSAKGLLCAMGRFSIACTPASCGIQIEIDAVCWQEPRPLYIDLPSSDPARISAKGAALEHTTRPGRFILRMEGMNAMITIEN